MISNDKILTGSKLKEQLTIQAQTGFVIVSS